MGWFFVEGVFLKLKREFVDVEAAYLEVILFPEPRFLAEAHGLTHLIGRPEDYFLVIF